MIFKNKWASLVMGTIALLFAGIIYAWSILKTPFMNEFGWDQGILGLNFTILMCFFCVGGMVGGALVKYMKPSKIMLLAAVCALAGYGITSRLQANTVPLLYIGYGLLAGLSIGIAYNVVIANVSQQFPGKKTTVTGILMLGFGASTLILGSILGAMFESMNWRLVYLILAIVSAVIFAVAAPFMQEPPKDFASPSKAASNPTAESSKNYTAAEMLKESSFWKAYILFVLMAAVGTCTVSIAKDVSLSVGSSERIAILMVGLLSVCNALGRLTSGFLFDKLGRRKNMLIANAITLVAPVLVLLSLFLDIAPLNAVGLCAVGFAYGYMPPNSSGYCMTMFGPKNFALNFGISNTMLIFASMSSTIGGQIYNATASFVPIFILLTILGVAAMAVYMSMRKIL